MNDYKTFLLLFALVVNGAGANGQVTLGEIVLLSTSPLKYDADPEAFKSFMLDEFVPAWNKGSSGSTMHLLSADRGDLTGEFLPVCMVANFRDRKNLGPGSPFDDEAALVTGAMSSRPSNFLARAVAARRAATPRPPRRAGRVSAGIGWILIPQIRLRPAPPPGHPVR